MNTAEQQFLKALDDKLWKAADKLRANLDAANYKHVVLGSMGSGGFFVSSDKFIEQHVQEKHYNATEQRKHISVYGQESNPTTSKLAAMNMAIRGIDFNFGKQNAGIKKLLIAFGKIAGSYLSKAKNNDNQNNPVTKFRDTLLPKLLSGEIDLSNIEKVATEATA